MELPEQIRPLPNYDQAIIDSAKFTEYSMNPHHPENQGKAVGFKQLGYDVDTSKGRIAAMQNVVVQLRTKLNGSRTLKYLKYSFL